MLNPPDILLVIHLVATLFMTGMIWFIQVVHYPLLKTLTVDRAEDYHHNHMWRTGWGVGPAMVVEATTALYFYQVPYPGTPTSCWLAGLALVGVIWLSTIGLQAPAHLKLRHDYDRSVVNWLVATNWIRTAGWSFRTVILSIMVCQHFIGGSVS